MKLGDIAGEGAPSPAPRPQITDADLIALGADALVKTDLARETDAAAKEARGKLMQAMVAAGKDEIVVQGRKLEFKETPRVDPTLKDLQRILGEEEGKRVWNLLPKKPYKRVEVPNALMAEPP